MFHFKKNLNRKSGFGIVEVMVSIVVLGFLYVALSKLQLGNHDTFLRIRGRDGAVEVAQQVLDSLKSLGVAAIPSCSNAASDTTFQLDTIPRQWERGLGGHVTVKYVPTLTVGATQDYLSENKSNFETVRHVYAKQVNVKVEWPFKGTTQSINVSGVIR